MLLQALDEVVQRTRSPETRTRDHAKRSASVWAAPLWVVVALS